MGNVTHTPGPLEVERCFSDYATEVVVPGKNGAFGTVVASCMHNWNDAHYDQRRISWAEATANANLFAAAPELLAAAEALGAMPEGYCFCSRDRIGDESKTHEPECRDLRSAIAKARGQ